MRIKANKLCIMISLLTLAACTPQAEKNPQEAFVKIHEACAKELPAKASKDAITLCHATKGDAPSQVKVAERSLAKARTKADCEQGISWLNTAATNKSTRAMMHLAELHKGQYARVETKGLLRCTQKGFVKKDPVQAFAYLQAAQDTWEAKKAADPKKLYATCSEDFKPTLDAWAAKMKPTDVAAAKALATTIIPSTK